MRLLNWNVEYAPATGARGRVISGVIEGAAADVLCLTETHLTWPMDGGHWIWAEADYGYEQLGGRRKVGLWSRAPWTAVDVVGHLGLPGGRFVAGVTQTDIGEVMCLGVCIPWRAANGVTGISRMVDGRRVSDHDGVVVDLAPA